MNIRRVVRLAVTCCLLLAIASRAQAQEKSDAQPVGSPVTLSLGSVRTAAEQAAIRLLIDLTKDLNSLAFQSNARSGLIYYSPDITIQTGSADAFDGIVAKVTGSVLVFSTTRVGGLETINTSLFHSFPFSVGAESDGRFQTVSAVAEAGYVPWFQGVAPRNLKKVFLGVFVQAGYKTDIGGSDTVTASGGKRDQSEELADEALMRLRGRARWEITRAGAPRVFDLGIRGSADVWYDLRNSTIYRRLAGTIRLYVARDRYMDFVYEKGSGAPNFNRGSQLSANLTVTF